MKTIEERAKAFCEKNICVDCGDRKDCDRKCLGTCIPTYDTFEWLIQFGKSEHSELTRWHDPKEELPPAETVVLVKITYGCGYALAERGDEGWWLPQSEEWEIPANQVIGWRDIHE